MSTEEAIKSYLKEHGSAPAFLVLLHVNNELGLYFPEINKVISEMEDRKEIKVLRRRPADDLLSLP